MAVESQRFTAGWSNGSALALSAVAELEGAWAVIGDFTLATGTVTDHQEQFGFDKDTLEGILIVVTGNPATTVQLETNATDHTGGQLLTFPASPDGAPCVLFWTNLSPLTNPITADVTTTYWTKTGVDTPRVQVRVLSGTAS